MRGREGTDISRIIVAFHVTIEIQVPGCGAGSLPAPRAELSELFDVRFTPSTSKRLL